MGRTQAVCFCSNGVSWGWIFPRGFFAHVSGTSERLSHSLHWAFHPAGVSSGVGGLPPSNGGHLSSKKHSQVGAAKIVTELRKPQSVTHCILLVKKVLRPAQVCKGRGIKISPLDCCGEQRARPSERERRHGWRPPWGLAIPWTKQNRCVGRIHPGAASIMSLNCQACVELDLTLFVVNGPARARSK